MSKDYSEADLERVIRETTRHGAVFVTMYFDSHGKGEEEVKNMLIDFIGRIANEKGVLYCKGEILPPFSRPEAGEGGATQDAEGNSLVKYSTSAEVKILADSFNKLVELAMRYGPIGVEINEPQEIRLPLDEAQTLLLEASSQAQEYAAYILKKTMTASDLAEFEERLVRRADLGKQLAERQKK